MSACKLHGEYACGKCMIVRNSLPERRFDTSPIYYEQKIGELHDRIAALERDLTQAVQMYTDAAGERDKALADLAAAQADLREHIALCLEANKLIDNAQAERDALRERANALLHQIDIGDYVDSEGHALKNNIAVLTLMKALTNV